MRATPYASRGKEEEENSARCCDAANIPPQDLAQHNCLLTNDFVSSWEYKEPDGTRGVVRVTARYASDNWEVLREWALAGLGVALKSTWDVYRQLADGSRVFIE